MIAVSLPLWPTPMQQTSRLHPTFQARLSRIWEEARLGVAALDQESQRMKQIGYLIAEGRRILDQLATSLIQGDAQYKNSLSSQGFKPCPKSCAQAAPA